METNILVRLYFLSHAKVHISRPTRTSYPGRCVAVLRQ